MAIGCQRRWSGCGPLWGLKMITQRASREVMETIISIIMPGIRVTAIVTPPVGTKRPNELGLYDMSRNVWEWTWDWKEETDYPSGPLNDYQEATSGTTMWIAAAAWSALLLTARLSNGHTAIRPISTSISDSVLFVREFCRKQQPPGPSPTRR